MPVVPGQPHKVSTLAQVTETGLPEVEAARVRTVAAVVPAAQRGASLRVQRDDAANDRLHEGETGGQARVDELPGPDTAVFGLLCALHAHAKTP